jgi:hypothetical protein
MTDFEVVPTEERPVRFGPAPISLALERGDTVFIPGATANSYAVAALRNKRSYLRQRGYVVVARQGQRNGVKGAYVWAERNAANGHES